MLVDIKYLMLVLWFKTRFGASVTEWFKWLTCNHLPLTAGGSSPTQGGLFMWGSYPAGLWKVGGSTQGHEHLRSSSTIKAGERLRDNWNTAVEWELKQHYKTNRWTIGASVAEWFKSLTCNHLPLTAGGSSPTRGGLFMWGSYTDG